MTMRVASMAKFAAKARSPMVDRCTCTSHDEGWGLTMSRAAHAGQASAAGLDN
jgi:hypothetical protein